jgi:hypothetical protein
MNEFPGKDQGAELRRQLGLLTEDEIAAIAGVEPATVKAWRSARTGPPWITMGRTPMYRRRSLVKWLAEQERRTDERGP